MAVIESLLEKIDLNNIQRSNIIVGKIGSGKHLLVTKLGEKLNLPVYDLTDKISLDELNEFMLNPTVKICLINGDDITVKEQNELLKFIEEPSSTTFIYIVCSNLNYILPTVKNRCIITYIPEYSYEELLTFCSNVESLKFFDTPGLIKKAEKYDLMNLIAYIDKIITSTGRANYSNVLSIKSKIFNLFPGLDKDINIFVLIFKKLLIDKIKLDGNPLLQREFICIDSFSKDLMIPKINKDDLFFKFLVDFKRCVDGY